MTPTIYQRTVLAAAGITALGIGVLILSAPQVFYAGYGIALGTDPSLLSELRSPAANLSALGLVMLAGVVWRAWTRVASVVALTVFLAFPAGRIVSLALDGVPSASVIIALVIELVIGALCVSAFGVQPQQDNYGSGRVRLRDRV